MLIVYCEKCGVRVPEEDLKNGAAVKQGSAYYCAKCAPPAPVTSRTSGVKASFSKRGTAAQVPQIKGSEPNSKKRQSSSMPIVIGAAGVSTLLLGILLLAGHTTPAPNDSHTAMDNNKPLPKVDPPTNKARPVTVLPGPAQSDGKSDFERFRNERAQRLLENANNAYAEKQIDTFSYHESLAEIVKNYKEAPAGIEAAKLAEKYPVPTLPVEEWKNSVNLMELINPATDKLSANWKLQNGELSCDSAGFGRIEIPYQPPEEYDFKMVFMRKEGNQDVTQIMNYNGMPFMWVMGIQVNTLCLFESIPNTVIQLGLENGRKYTSVVQVRHDGVRAFLDGKMVARGRTDFKVSPMRGEWQVRNTKLLGVGCHEGVAIFYRLELLPVTGTGKATRGAGH